jgi:hypothetical protein
MFDVDRTYIPTLRVRVHDYPGENSYREQAIKDLSRLGRKAVVILILKVGYFEGKIVDNRDNADYFNRRFVENLSENLNRLSDAIAKPIVVFNKADLLPNEWEPSVAIDEMKKANSAAMENILNVFGNDSLDFCLTSARTNMGIVRLLGLVGKVGIDSPQELERFERKIKFVRNEVEDRASDGIQIDVPNL